MLDGILNSFFVEMQSLIYAIQWSWLHSTTAIIWFYLLYNCNVQLHINSALDVFLWLDWTILQPSQEHANSWLHESMRYMSEFSISSLMTDFPSRYLCKQHCCIPTCHFRCKDGNEIIQIQSKATCAWDCACAFADASCWKFCSSSRNLVRVWVLRTFAASSGWPPYVFLHCISDR